MNCDQKNICYKNIEIYDKMKSHDIAIVLVSLQASSYAI